MTVRAMAGWALLALLAATSAFWLKYERHGREEELARIEGATANSHEQIRILRAEWDYLRRPERLAELARRHLDLAPVAPARMARLADLPLRPDLGPEQGPEAGAITAVLEAAAPETEGW